MTAYEKCDFGVCNIQDSDYDKLQVEIMSFLYHLHFHFIYFLLFYSFF